MSGVNQNIWSVIIILGVMLVLIGAAGFWSDKMPFLKILGNMPGDIRIEKEGFRFYFPIVTCLVISGCIAFIVWIIRRFF